MIDGEPKMTGAEVVAEVEWLLVADVHVCHIAKALGRSVEAIEKMCRDYGRDDLSAAFRAEMSRIRYSRMAKDPDLRAAEQQYGREKRARRKAEVAA